MRKRGREKNEEREGQMGEANKEEIREREKERSREERERVA